MTGWRHGHAPRDFHIPTPATSTSSALEARIRGLLIRQGRAVTTKADSQCAHPTSVNLLPSFIKGPAARQPVSQSVRREIRGPCREVGLRCRRASMRGRLLLLNVPSCPPAAMPPSRPETPCQGQSAGVPRGRVLSLSCLSSTRVDGLRLASPRLASRGGCGACLLVRQAN